MYHKDIRQKQSISSNPSKRCESKLHKIVMIFIIFIVVMQGFILYHYGGQQNVVVTSKIMKASNSFKKRMNGKLWTNITGKHIAGRKPYFVNESTFKYWTPWNMTIYDKAFHAMANNLTKGIGPELNPVYIDEYNFAVCMIPKNGIVLLKMIILRILNPLNDEKWWIMDGDIHDNPQIYQRRLIPANFNETQISNIYNNKSIKFFVFIRDPLQRALSGYLYFNWKLKINSFHDLPKYIWNKIEKHEIINQHIRPQHLFCDLDHTITRYIQFSFHNHSHRKSLLDGINPNLWNEIGKTKWHPLYHEKLNEEYKQQSNVKFIDYSVMDKNKQSLIDFESPTFHSVSTNDKLLEYFTMDIISDLLIIYKRDYQLFKLKLPDFICQVINIERNKYQPTDFQTKHKTLLNTIYTNFELDQYPSCI